MKNETAAYNMDTYQKYTGSNISYYMSELHLQKCIVSLPFHFATDIQFLVSIHRSIKVLRDVVIQDECFNKVH